MLELTIRDAFKALDDILDDDVLYVDNKLTTLTEAATKKTNTKIVESVKNDSKKVVQEAYYDSSFEVTKDGKKVSAVCETRSTRTYNYEEVTFKFWGGTGFGRYRWMNRPWERFRFADALQQAMVAAGVDKNFANTVIENSSSVDSAVKYFADNYTTEKVESCNKVEEKCQEESCEKAKCKESTLVEEPIYDLKPEEDSRASFYGKAIVKVDDDGTATLYSYNVPVVKLKDGVITLGKDWRYSATTLRHVKEFLKQHGFKAENAKQIEADYKVDVVEEAKCEALKEAKEVDINDQEEVKQGLDILNDDTEVEREEQIVDVDASTVDELKDSYIGNVILQCPVCRTLIYKKPDAITKSEEDEKIYNKDEECPHCGSQDGFELVGQVATLDVEIEEPESTTGVEDEIETDVEDIPVEDVPVDEVEKEETEYEFESLDQRRFDKLTNAFVKKVYENVSSYKTTNVKFDNDNNNVIIEGVLTSNSGATKDTKFTFTADSIVEDAKCAFKGINETFSNDEDSFELIGRCVDKNLICESLSYNYGERNIQEGMKEVSRIVGRVALRN